MTKTVLSVDENAGFIDIADTLYIASVRALPVVDTDRTLLGVISEADVLRTAERADPSGAATRRWRYRPRHTHRTAPTGKAGATTARELMTTDVVTIGPDATVAKAAALMRVNGLSWLPVVDARRRVLGVLGRSDLLLVFFREDDAIRAEIVEDVLRRSVLADPAGVLVEVADGVVTLTGELDTHADAVLAARLTEQVEGVIAVIDHLRWRVDERVADASVGPLY
ncbi:CBS domain-containing protein [Pseudonocardia sp. GCM10023141]|uniref:CBS domain-containing protein n=1 Tax=Pseudonocardia sp. GCM10023141 TaxID=3252653 RepID=UPI00361E2F8C